MINKPKFQPGDILHNRKDSNNYYNIEIIGIFDNCFYNAKYNNNNRITLTIDFVDNNYILVNNNKNKTMWNYQIKTPNPETQNIVRDYLHSLGFDVNDKATYYGFFPYLVLNLKDKCYSSDNTGNEKLFGKFIDFNFLFSPEFAAEFKKSQEPDFVEVVLNQQYTAKVYKDKVVVGCQTFDWSLIKEMVEVQKKLD